MDNVIQIRHGADAPQKGDLAEYELGYSTKEKALYIGIIDSAGVLDAIPITAQEVELAKKATQLKTAQTIQVNLESTDAAQFDGTAGIEPGIKGKLPLGSTSGTLPVNRGGTGATSAEDARANLDITAANLGVSAYVKEEEKTLYITTHN